MPAERARLIDLAERWIADDPDADTRAELRALVDAEDIDALAERFAAPLEFGTAGLRGLLGAGLSRMNAANVARAAHAVAKDALARDPDAAHKGIVVGRDGRHKSDELARISAEVIAGLGVRVHWLPDPSPTPVAAFLGVYLDAAAVVVVTASHNPPAYNGFKVYSARGSQIVSPQDADIRAIRDAVERVADLPRVAFTEGVEKHLVRVVGEREKAAFFEALEAQCLGPVPPPAQVSAVTTSLHGVGHPWLLEMLARRGHRHVFPVLAQAAPDGDFPTVAFPNPEEKGALDLAYALGRDKYAELIVANDPDADRLAAAVRDDASDTGYRPLSGNELGLLLGDWLLSEGARRGALPERSLVVTTIVSTTALEALAAARGARYREVLTGFKWILDAAFEGAERGETFVFGFEEALGYCCGRAVRDKDGIGAAAVLMELAAALKARGKTLLDRLDELALEIGVTATDQVAVTLAGADGIARIGRVMAAIRAEPPEWIGGVAVRRSRDLASAADAEAAGLPGGDVLTYWLEGGGRVVMRPSGTEPKLKCYLEASAPVGDAGLDAARADAKALVGRLAAWVRARIDQILTTEEAAMSELDEGYQLEMAEYVREEKELKAKLAVVEQKLVGPEAKLQKAREIVLKAKAAYDQINAEVTPLRSEKTLLLGELELVGEKKAKIRHEAALAKGGYGMRPGTTQLVEQMKEIAGDPEEFAMKKELAKSDAAAALAELKKKMGQE